MFYPKPLIFNPLCYMNSIFDTNYLLYFKRYPKIIIRKYIYIMTVKNSTKLYITNIYYLLK